MRIEIDTNKDSQTDIRKAIQLLQSLHGDFHSNDPALPATGNDAFASMFATPDQPQQQACTTENEEEIEMY